MKIAHDVVGTTEVLSIFLRMGKKTIICLDGVILPYQGNRISVSCVVFSAFPALVVAMQEAVSSFARSLWHGAYMSTLYNEVLSTRCEMSVY